MPTIPIIDLFVLLYAFAAGVAIITALQFRANGALRWQALAIFLATLQLLSINLGVPLPWRSYISVALLPAALLAAAQTIRLLTHSPPVGRPLLLTVGGLAGAAALLNAFGASFVMIDAFFQMACAVAALDPVRHLLRQSKVTLVDYWLALTFATMVGTNIAIVPLEILRADSSRGVTALASDPSILGLQITNAILGVTAVVATVLKAVGGTLDNLKIQSERDGLTGLSNRMGFEQLIRGDVGWKGGLLLCDLDRFKEINDTYGHAVGDRVLQEIGRILSEYGSSAGRIGGEEFAVVLRGRSVEGAVREAERLRLAIRDRLTELLPDERGITASFGVTSLSGDEPLEKAMRRADIALYHAKANGRDAVSRYDTGMEDQLAKGSRLMPWPAALGPL